MSVPPLRLAVPVVAQPWLRFHTPLIEPDVRISRIRLSDKTSRRLSRATPRQFLKAVELIGCPISMSFTTSCVCLELRPLPSPALPVSAVLQASPPPQSIQPVPHGRPVGPVIPDLTTLRPSRVARAFLVYVLPPLPVQRRAWSVTHPAVSAFPISLWGSSCHVVFEVCSAFTRVAARTLAPSPVRDQLHRRLQPFRYLHDCPAASGWSGCRVGLAPTGKRRLVTAHT